MRRITIVIGIYAAFFTVWYIAFIYQPKPVDANGNQLTERVRK